MAIPDEEGAAPSGGAEEAATPPSRCRSCEAELHGRYCSSCGQEAKGSARAFRTLAADAWDAVANVDGRLWATLRGLLFKPGFLTEEYLLERRARYLPPFRLYLVASILFFALAALDSPDRPALEVVGGDPGAPAVAAARDRALEAAAKEVEQAAKELEAAGQPGLARTLQAGEGGVQGADPGQGCAGLAGVGGGRLGAALVRACEQTAADGGRALGRAFLGNVPQAMFLFLPLVALVLFLLFGRSRRFYVEHLVLVLHLHASLFLLFAFAMLAEAGLGRGLGLGRLSGVLVAFLWG